MRIGHRKRSRYVTRKSFVGSALCRLHVWITVWLVSLLVPISRVITPSVAEEQELHHGWAACRIFSVLNPALGCLENNRRPGTSDAPFLLNVTQLPTTALAVLLNHQQISEAPHVTMENLYDSQNLALIPDINVTGREYYTLLYQIEIPPPEGPPTHRRIVHFAGINYRATVWYNGVPLRNLQTSVTTSFPKSSSDASPSELSGMFVRHRYDITDVANNSSSSNLLVVRIEPPDHPGYPVARGQGGSHDLAQDGAIPQYMLGWDWCSSMPDRSTGFYGSVTVQSSSNGRYTIHDPAIQTVALENCAWFMQNWRCSAVSLRILVRIEEYSRNSLEREWTLSDETRSITLKINADWGEEWILCLDDLGGPTTVGGFVDIQEDLDVISSEKIRLWWPHGVGIDNFAHLHSFSIALFVDDIKSDSVTIPVGIRKIDTFLDDKIQGQRFRINGHDLYLVGGNWIGTDQALRYSASEQRYCDEILLHQHAGLNLIRVWGGGTAERGPFYNCADRFGILVFQEFWMTGDNNGRWAGDYSWPLEYHTYLANVEDTVKRLRQHPSLLFYGGCNECLSPQTSKWAPNPPREIDDGIRRLIEQFDPDRFYISSSMGGPNKGDAFVDPSLYYNRSYSLAYADGPYGMLLSTEFFCRNPGLPHKNVSIGFQPEIGSVSVPTYSGLLKFMSLEEARSGYPSRALYNSNETTWDFHKFLPWTSQLPNNETYDHVYAYFGANQDVGVLDWTAAAQLAAHTQYQNLFNGFITNMFIYTSAVIMWKTQSPWPALRGFLYDWYLESTGALIGVRSALHSPIAIVFDAQSWQLNFVNRQVLPVSTCSFQSTGAHFAWIDLHGKTMASGEALLSLDFVPPMSSHLLARNNYKDKLRWPNQCTDVCFLRLQAIGCGIQSPSSWYWLTDPLLGDAGNFSQLGELRRHQIHLFDMEVEHCMVKDDQVCLDVILRLERESPDVLFYPTLSLHRESDGSQILPLLDMDDANIVILPGTSQRRHLYSPARIGQDTSVLVVKLSSWNTPDISKQVFCSTRSRSQPQ